MVCAWMDWTQTPVPGTQNITRTPPSQSHTEEPLHTVGWLDRGAVEEETFPQDYWSSLGYYVLYNGLKQNIPDPICFCIVLALHLLPRDWDSLTLLEDMLQLAPWRQVAADRPVHHGS